MIRILVILGSTRDNRFSERAGQWVVERPDARGDMEVELVDLRDHPLPFFDGMAPARTLRDYPSAETRRFGELLDRADGFVIVTPEYNHGYSGRAEERDRPHLRRVAAQARHVRRVGQRRRRPRDRAAAARDGRVGGGAPPPRREHPSRRARARVARRGVRTVDARRARAEAHVDGRRPALVGDRARDSARGRPDS